MDEKEQADRLAAAEALFMISNRGEKPQIPVRPRPTRRGKKQKVVDYDDITASKRKIEDPKSISPRSRSRSKSSDGANPTNDRGRGRRGGLNKRGRGRGRGKKQTYISRIDKSRSKYDSEPDDNNVPILTIDTEPSRVKSSDLDLHDPLSPKAHKGRGKKRGGKAKAKAQAKPSKPHVEELEAVPVSDNAPALGLSGASLSKSGSSSTRADTSQDATVLVQTTAGGNLPSLGLVSGFHKVSLASKSHAGPETSALPSLNLTSFSEGNLPSVNLPSLPSEYPFLQLPSQPTPNLSSLGDVAVSQPAELDPQGDRDKSEKFLPLKKRKLHKADESASTPTTVATDSPVDGLSVSDSEERYEAISPEPARAPFTVQAPPIITMQTLMEIKTALQADDDGDLPLHIAVVHENMRMVAKLISLMRIAGKNVDKFNKQQQTPLHLAIKLDFTEAVQLLLKSGADVNAVDCSGSSAIHMAVQGRSTPILHLLLEKCPNVQLNNRNIDGLTPLHLAVDNGDLEQAELLLKHGADIDVTDGKSGRTPLFRAAESNHKPMVELLLKRGANVDVASYAGVTVSMAAQGRNLHGVLKLLGSVQDKFGVSLDAGSAPGAPSKSPTTNPPPPLLYVGFPPISKSSLHSSDAVGNSSGSVTPTSISPPVLTTASSPVSAQYHSLEGEKREQEPLTYLVRPQTRVGRADMTSGGVMLERADTGSVTKVFHNVFMMTDGKKGRVQMESISEPSSPMDVDGEKIDPWRKGKPKVGGGLLSLPEMIEVKHNNQVALTKEIGAAQRISTLDSAVSKPTAMVIRRVAVGSPKHSQNSSAKESAHGMTGSFISKVSSDVDVVMHLVPSTSVPMILSSSAGSSSPVSRLATQSSALKSLGQISSSPPVLLPVLSSALPTSKPSSPLLTSSSSSSPKSGATPSQGGDTTTTPLSSIQAKLYQTLLRRSQSHPGSSPTTQEMGGASQSVMSKLLISPVQVLPLSASSSSPGVVSYKVVPSSSSDGGLSKPITVRSGSKQVPLIRVPSLAQVTTVTKSTGSSPTSSPPGTPLNLTKPSIRRFQDCEGLPDSTSTSSAGKIIEMGVTVGDGSSVATQGKSSKELPNQPVRKIISIGVRRVSSSEKSSTPPPSLAAGASSTGFQGQYEMYVMPQKQQSEGQPHSSPGKKAVNVIPKSFVAPVSTGIKSDSQRPSIVLDSAMVETMSKGEISLSNFPHISKCVRDLFARQNQLFQKPSSSVSSSLNLPATSSSTLPGSSAVLATTVAKSLVPTHHPPGRIVLPSASVTQNSIMGLSGAILSDFPVSKGSSGTPDKAAQSEEQRSHHTKKSSKEPSTKKSRSRGANKSQRGGQHSDASSSSVSSAGHSVSSSGEPVPNLSKINSETDQKLKKFLVAKRQEGLLAVKARTGEWQEALSGRSEVAESSGESLDDSNSLKTVGIFSGNVQKVRLGKSRSYTTSAVSSVQSSPTIPTCGASTNLPSIILPSTLLSFSSSDEVEVLSPSLPTGAVTSGVSKKSLEDSASATESTAVVASSPKFVATEKESSAGSRADASHSVSVMDEDDEADDDGEEPMEIDIPEESASNSPASERTLSRCDPGQTKPSVTASGNLMMSKVEIVIHSPTPPLPVETSDTGKEQEVDGEKQGSRHNDEKT